MCQAVYIFICLTTQFSHLPFSPPLSFSGIINVLNHQLIFASYKTPEIFFNLCLYFYALDADSKIRNRYVPDCFQTRFHQLILLACLFCADPCCFPDVTFTHFFLCYCFLSFSSEFLGISSHTCSVQVCFVYVLSLYCPLNMSILISFICALFTSLPNSISSASTLCHISTFLQNYQYE